MPDGDDGHTPTYEVGQIYQDAKGERYIRVDDFAYPWRFIDWPAGTVEPRDDSFPHRPLRKLVPEGS